jgi:hypothetical protein
MAIPSEARKDHGTTAHQPFTLAQEIQELSDGYAVRFRNEPGKFMAIAKFIENDGCAVRSFTLG